MKMLLAFILSSCLAAPDLKRPAPTTNQKIKVMVIDTGITSHPLITPYLVKGTEVDKTEFAHGTHVTGIILYGDMNRDPEAVCGEVEIHSCTFYKPVNQANFDMHAQEKTIKCLNRALDERVDFINYSAGGDEGISDEAEVFRQLGIAGIKVVTVAGNDGRLLKSKHGYYPGSYEFENNLDNVIQVGNMSYDGKIRPTSNYIGGIIYDYGEGILSTISKNEIGLMTGTSQSAAMYMHRLLLRRCRQIQELQKVRNKIILKPGGQNGPTTNSGARSNRK